MHIAEALDQSQPGLFRRVTRAIEKHNLSQRTEQAYLHWIQRFLVFHDLKSVDEIVPADHQSFIHYLEESIPASRARQNQARLALRFFFQDVLGMEEMPTSVA
ncbi:site-specific integrase [Marinobacter sp. X15-166B]|uniref:site-specific integrase n=1 Tax=Marinobacter sp. X15-166B TaxID=1897620 RepID=UPI00085C601F|nr:site-specific integrase [Marinobacter sp. X15-166B]OEY65832.1 integrase [Marinobacter sp. X15-166B]